VQDPDPLFLEGSDLVSVFKRSNLDPDSVQNRLDPEHWLFSFSAIFLTNPCTFSSED
jgi:hypothetical protein